MPERNESPQINRARRHLVGAAAAAATKMAVIGTALSTLPHSLAQATWWDSGHRGRGQANGRGSGNGGPLCLLRGTSILTRKGKVSIEDLRIGDLVDTVRSTALPVKWIGRQI